MCALAASREAASAAQTEGRIVTDWAANRRPPNKIPPPVEGLRGLQGLPSLGAAAAGRFCGGCVERRGSEPDRDPASTSVPCSSTGGRECLETGKLCLPGCRSAVKACLRRVQVLVVMLTWEFRGGTLAVRRRRFCRSASVASSQY